MYSEFNSCGWEYHFHKIGIKAKDLHLDQAPWYKIILYIAYSGENAGEVILPVDPNIYHSSDQYAER